MLYCQIFIKFGVVAYLKCLIYTQNKSKIIRKWVEFLLTHQKSFEFFFAIYRMLRLFLTIDTTNNSKIPKSLKSNPWVLRFWVHMRENGSKWIRKKNLQKWVLHSRIRKLLGKGQGRKLIPNNFSRIRKNLGKKSVNRFSRIRYKLGKKV